MSIYEGTIGEREYAHGRDEGRLAGEWDARNYPATVWDRIEDVRGDLPTARFKTRCYLIGWLRGYREIVR